MFLIRRGRRVTGQWTTEDRIRGRGCGWKRCGSGTRRQSIRERERQRVIRLVAVRGEKPKHAVHAETNIIQEGGIVDWVVEFLRGYDRLEGFVAVRIRMVVQGRQGQRGYGRCDRCTALGLLDDALNGDVVLKTIQELLDAT